MSMPSLDPEETPPAAGELGPADRCFQLQRAAGLPRTALRWRASRRQLRVSCDACSSRAARPAGR